MDMVKMGMQFEQKSLFITVCVCDLKNSAVIFTSIHATHIINSI